MHGISTVIVVILLLMISVALSALVYTFFTKVMTSVTASGTSAINQTIVSATALMKVESISINTVYVRSIGKSDLSDFSVYLNDEPADFTITPSVVKPGEVGAITITDLIKENDEIKITTTQGTLASKKAPDPCNQAVLCLKFDEGFGITAKDSSGQSGNDGNLGTNIIPNPGFESGLWRSSSFWSLDSSIFHNGIYSAKLSNSNSNCNDYQYVDLPITSNKNYFISAWIKTDEPTATFVSRVGIANTSWGNFYLSPKSLTGVNDWTWVNLTGYDSNLPNNGNLRFFATESHCPPPNTGTVWFDDVYAGYDIPIWTDGKFEKALQFDGIDDYVNTFSAINVGGSFTLEGWIKLNPTQKSYPNFIANREAGLGDGFSFWVKTTQMVWESGNSTHNENFVSNPYSSIAGTFVHAALVYNNGIIKFYLNGKLAGPSHTATVTNFNKNRRIYIGSFANLYVDGFLNGIVDEIRIYNKAIY